MKFILFSSGKIDGLKLATSSGNEDCDKAALSAVNCAQPFENLPDGSPPRVDIEFNFDYNVWKKGGKFVLIDNVPEQTFSPTAGAALCIKHGLTAMEGKNYLLAIQFFQKALDLEPSNDTAKKDLSNSYNSLAADEFKANPNRAMENFKKAKEFWPENPMTPGTLEQAQKLYGQPLNAGTLTH